MSNYLHLRLNDQETKLPELRNVLLDKLLHCVKCLLARGDVS
jgi:hypothetical protein